MLARNYADLLADADIRERRFGLLKCLDRYHSRELGPWHDSSAATRGTTIHRARRRRREARATDQRRSRQAASIRLPAEA